MSPLIALFPSKSRFFAGIRWVKIALRTLHLLGIAGVGGGYLYQAPPDFWASYFWLIIATGVLLVAIEIWSNGVWLIQIRGIAVLLKLILLACVPLAPELGGPILIAVIIISGIVSHAPKSVRYYSLLHGRRIESLHEPAKSHR